MDNILSGLIGLMGVILGSIITIDSQNYFDKKQKEFTLAKERLEKIYGPLLLIFEANKNLNLNEEKFLFRKIEEKEVDKLLLKNYYLIEEDKKTILLNLYRHRKFSKEVPEKDIISTIKKGYMENWARLK